MSKGKGYRIVKERKFPWQAFKEACVDTGIATVINFPINILLLYIAANTFVLWMDSQEQEIFWTSVYLTVCFGTIAIIRKTIIRHYFDKKNRKKEARNA